jgi:hypothetical protein
MCQVEGEDLQQEEALQVEEVHQEVEALQVQEEAHQEVVALQEVEMQNLGETHLKSSMVSTFVNTFMNQFNLYQLFNMEAPQMHVPMKCADLLLGFIKGPNVDDWVKL